MHKRRSAATSESLTIADRDVKNFVDSREKASEKASEMVSKEVLRRGPLVLTCE